MCAQLLVLSSDSGLADAIRRYFAGRFHVVTAPPACVDEALAGAYQAAIFHITAGNCTEDSRRILSAPEGPARSTLRIAVADAACPETPEALGPAPERIRTPLDFGSLQRLLETGMLQSSIPAEPETDRAAQAVRSLTLEDRVNAAEREIIDESLRRHNFRRTDTARELGISRVTLYNKMKKFGMLG